MEHHGGRRRGKRQPTGDPRGTGHGVCRAPLNRIPPNPTDEYSQRRGRRSRSRRTSTESEDSGGIGIRASTRSARAAAGPELSMLRGSQFPQPQAQPVGGGVADSRREKHAIPFTALYDTSKAGEIAVLANTLGEAQSGAAGCAAPCGAAALRADAGPARCARRASGRAVHATGQRRCAPMPARRAVRDGLRPHRVWPGPIPTITPDYSWPASPWRSCPRSSSAPAASGATGPDAEAFSRRGRTVGTPASGLQGSSRTELGDPVCGCGPGVQDPQWVPGSCPVHGAWRQRARGK